ncbi:transmembrane protein, putative (macronuclear) [Tetrahymena thermophila SB210]|uniref:Transmembrane protein, putative n=1 Tax=Tetrahymena thermophila (strain SB210) TaxID=312017 RepID=I7MFW5_TETTS|nr:transmembrane protein, putative [Tetrahymena thermophila SB210]EAS00660.2 transmembrane protein, putative [Tetrahymena thermophila SB210]|eukprot:XP_001020905.2 transmembrane protein, putative [Tetrahymena thermophila SB210]
MLSALRFIKRIDIFGAEVGLKYEGQNKYTSRLGGFATLIVGCLISAIFYQQFYQIYNRVNSNLIYEQNFVEIPRRYNLTTHQFSFMIGLQDQNTNPVIDEDIFTIEAIFQFKKPIVQNGTTTYELVSNKVPVGPCTEDDFQVEDIKGYFLSQPYQKYYCLKNQNELYLEGQFDQNFFSVLQFKISECIDKPSCKSPDIRQQFIKTSYAQIYYTDRIVQTQNFEQPFKNVGKTQYYNIFYDYLQQSSFVFTNTKISDDIGLLVESLSIQTQLQFVNDRYQLQSKTTNEFFEISIYLDKNKENSYYRSYKKIPEALSQLGGNFQVLFFLGCLFIQPYNLLKLKNRLHKDIFSVENQNLNKKESSPKSNKKRKNSSFNFKAQSTIQNIINQSQLDYIDEEKIPDQESNKFQFIEKLKEFLGIVPQYIKQQYQEIENMRSIKTIINTQIQFIFLKNLFYQIDFLKIKLINQQSQVFDNKSKNLIETCSKENIFFNQSNIFKQYNNQSFSNLKMLNINDFNIKNDKIADMTVHSLIKNEEDNSKFFSKQNSPLLRDIGSSKKDDVSPEISSKQFKLSQNFDQNQEKNKSEIDVESQSPSIQDLESYIKIFNSIKSLNKNQFQNSIGQLNSKDIKNNQSTNQKQNQ